MKLNFLKESAQNVFYHGTSSNLEDLPKTLPFKTRSTPKDTNILLHNSINNATAMRFGIKVRNLFFMSSTASYSEMYGNVYIVEAADKNDKAYFNRDYYDLTVELRVHPLVLPASAKRNNFKVVNVPNITDNSDIEDYYNQIISMFENFSQQSEKDIIYDGDDFEKDLEAAIHVINEYYKEFSEKIENYVAGLEVCTFEELEGIRFKYNCEIMLHAKNGIKFIREIE